LRLSPHGFGALTLLLLAGCGDSLAPFEPEITNAPDNFQFQATGLSDVTWSQEYVWQNSGATADVDHSSAVTAGTTLLTIRDSTGSQVYASPLLASGSLATLAGTAGSWRITVSLTNVSGTINFRVQ